MKNTSGGYLSESSHKSLMRALTAFVVVAGVLIGGLAVGLDNLGADTVTLSLGMIGLGLGGKAVQKNTERRYPVPESLGGG